MNGAPDVDCHAPGVNCDTISSTRAAPISGIDLLEAINFEPLKEAAVHNGGHLRIGLLTNQTGVDAQGRRTIDVLRGIGNGIELTTLFSPEHGLFGAKDSTSIGQEVDPASGLKVISLYGAKDEDRRPKPDDLWNLDAVVIDLQDAGVRFYTYETVLGYFLEASARELARVTNWILLCSTVPIQLADSRCRDRSPKPRRTPISTTPPCPCVTG